jgi:2-keto-3-deoxy-galactonokinase
LTETLAPEQLAWYLSGILIASELLDSPWADQVRSQAVHLIGDSTVLEPYSIVMQELGITVQCHDEAFVAAGIHLLAMSRALPAGSADPSTSMNLRP